MCLCVCTYIYITIIHLWLTSVQSLYINRILSSLCSALDYPLQRASPGKGQMEVSNCRPPAGAPLPWCNPREGQELSQMPEKINQWYLGNLGFTTFSIEVVHFDYLRATPRYCTAATTWTLIYSNICIYLLICVCVFSSALRVKEGKLTNIKTILLHPIYFVHIYSWHFTSLKIIHFLN